MMQGLTALTYAVRGKHSSIASQLIAEGADVNLTDSKVSNMQQSFASPGASCVRQFTLAPNGFGQRRLEAIHCFCMHLAES